MQLQEQSIYSEESKTWREWFQTINWVSVVVLFFSPLFALYGFFFVTITTKTLIWTIIFYFLTGFGITAGYHRLWSHKSYSATYPVRLLLMLLSSGAWQGSIIWWARNHRIHHRYTDQPQDPYTVNRGLFHAHFGWMLFHKESKYYEFNKTTDISDLLADPLVVFQKKYYPVLALFVGIAVPVGVAGFGWGDWRGGFFYACIFRSVIVSQATFCINSLAHYYGDATFDDQRSPRDSNIVSLITFGEGYHNFHHEFPNDYRNGVGYKAYDPSKWIVFLLSFVGFTFNLKRFPSNEIEKGKLQMIQKNLDAKKSLIQWGPNGDRLPLWTKEQFDEKVKNGESLIIVDGIAHQVASFVDQHPGGKHFILSHLGQDVTDLFEGGVYAHSNAAHNLLSMFRSAVVSPDTTKNLLKQD